MKEIVKYNNDFNLTSLNHLNQTEMDIFITICSQFTKQKIARIKVEYSDLKQATGLTDKKYTDDRFRQFMIATQAKMVKTDFSLRTDKGLVQRPLFREFLTPNDEPNVVYVELDDLFLNYLYDIPAKISFTQFELMNFLQLKSKYSKTLLRYLLQNYQEIWTIDFKEFKELIGFKASYNSGIIVKRLPKIIDEINSTAIISNLKYELHRNYKKRGEPIESITFTYQISNQIKNQVMQPAIAIEEKVHKRTVTIPSDNPLYGDQVKSIEEVEKITRQETCPRCGGCLMTATATSKANKGRKYKVCENSKYYKATPNNDCKYFEWIDNTDFIEPLSEPATPKKSLDDLKEDLLNIVYDYAKRGFIATSTTAPEEYRDAYFELLSITPIEERDTIQSNILKFAQEYHQNKK